MSPAALMPPGVIRPQSLPHDLLEIAGESGCALRQQHFARLFLQQDMVGALNTLAASGAREANEKSKIRHAGTTARASPMCFFLFNIPWERSITRSQNLAAQADHTTCLSR